VADPKTSDPRSQDARSAFDRIAQAASAFAGRAVFFVGCMLVVLLWLPSFFIVGDIDTWQLIINTITTIVTFLLVALLQNVQRRSELALQQKLNAIADGLADLMEHQAQGETGDLARDTEDLRRAAGLEQRI
jgi:low affinity Fe/Cu permease